MRQRPAFRTVVVAALALGLPPAVAADPAREADRALHGVLAADGGTGIMAAVVIDGRLVWSAALGWADLEGRIPLRRDHRLRVGSVSKPLTAAAALKLVERGAIDIDAPIQTYVPAFPRKQRPITLRLLAAHTSGIRHVDFSNYEEANNVKYAPHLADGLDRFANEPLLFAPGEGFAYTSFGFDLIGVAVEAAAREPFGAALQTLLAKPLMLTGTMIDHPLEIVPNRARFYTVTAANPVYPWMKDRAVINTIMLDNSLQYPSAGLLSTAEDLARFADAVFNSSFLDARTKPLATTPARLASGQPVAWRDRSGPQTYTFGWGAGYDGSGGIAYFGHGGETNGAYALVRHYPKARLSIAAIANYNMVADTVFFDTVGETLPALFAADIGGSAQ